MKAAPRKKTLGLFSLDKKEPVAEFPDSLDRKMNAKLIGLMELHEEKGTGLREPYSAPLEKGQARKVRSALSDGITEFAEHLSQ